MKSLFINLPSHCQPHICGNDDKWQQFYSSEGDEEERKAA